MTSTNDTAHPSGNARPTSEPLVVDVLVIGAGPSGAAAATVLARSGKHVVVVDKASFPRDKCCGDGLTTLALRELEGLGVQPAAIENWQTVSEVMLRSPSGRHVTMRLPGDGIAAATTPRRELDLAVIRNAQAAGATLIDGLALATITPTPAGITATLTPHGRDADAQPHSSRPSWVGREIRAGFVVAADGVWSPTRKLLGLSGDGYRGEWHAFRQY
ncbi:MAG TPA: FAD-dependent monooxygenase, partial [Ilumatobacteraceae bacterium]|nr:FAD-dependent monooxygenase [Ilumatobacteraceae bacterium]